MAEFSKMRRLRSRRNRSVLNSSSSSFIARVREGWATWHSSAARVKFQVCATARKYLIWCISMEAPAESLIRSVSQTIIAAAIESVPHAFPIRRYLWACICDDARPGGKSRWIGTRSVRYDHGDGHLQRCSGDSVGPDVAQPLHRRILRPWPGKSGLGQSRHGWSAGLEPPELVRSLVQHWTKIDLPLSTATFIHHVVGIFATRSPIMPSAHPKNWGAILDVVVLALFTIAIGWRMRRYGFDGGEALFWLVVALTTATRFFNPSQLHRDALSWGSFTWFNALGIMAPLAGPAIPLLLLEGGAPSFMSWAGHVLFGYLAVVIFERLEATR